jgi:hypothetical protein
MLMPRFTIPALTGLAAVALGCILTTSGSALRAAEEGAKVNFVLDRAAAKPGDIVKLVLKVQSNVAVLSMSIALDFDESKVRVWQAWRLPDFSPSTDPSNLDPPGGLDSVTVSNVDNQTGNQMSEGWLHLELKSAAADAPVLGNDAASVDVLAIQFLVLPSAAPGFTPIGFEIIGPLDSLTSTYYMNRVVVAGGKGEEAPASMEGGGIDIIGEIGFFMRGDSNYDERRDISDPILTIGHLFLGDGLPCPDSADANDDGLLDVSDPIFSLRILFQEFGRFPDPSEWGEDPTPDDLGCPVAPAQ